MPRGFLASVLALSVFGAVLLGSGSAATQEGLPDAAAVVRPHAYVSLTPVPRGRAFQVAVVVDILKGFHLNVHKPSDEFLIPTTLTAQLPEGIRELETTYPQGRLKKFSFSPSKPLSVYTGSVTIRMKLLAQSSAPLGPQAIPFLLRYQACNDTTCLPPVRIPVKVTLVIAAANAKARAAHPEVFGNRATPPRP